MLEKFSCHGLFACGCQRFFTLSLSVISSLFFYFLWLIFLVFSTVFFLAPHFQYIYSQKDVHRVFGIFFNFSIVVLSTKLNRRLLKTMAIFLNFVVKTALI